MLRLKIEELLALKEANERLAIEEEKTGATFCEAMPVQLTLETTLKCNMRCIMCQVFRDPETARKAGVADSVMPFELFERVARETFPTAKWMSPTVMGEPLLTPYFPKILDLLNEYSVKMNMVTNGIYLTERVSEELMPHLSRIKVSFDGAKKSTFERIRRGSNFDRIVDNVRRFSVVRERLSLEERPILTFQVVLMRENIEELPEIVEIASDLGADEIGSSHVYVFDPVFEHQSLLKHREIADECLGAARERAKELGMLTHFPRPFKEYGVADTGFSTSAEGVGSRGCKFLWREAWIGHKGHVTPCCVPDRPIVGDLCGTPFGDVWNSTCYQEMRARLSTDSPFGCCRNCSLATQYEGSTCCEYDESRFFLYDNQG